ncbi:hypothetical protein LEP1GSC131_0610 [Leptospira kirschneri str. 200802841]|uniref:Uncharacterized protein n=1 Tax=Leptospira kirschneri str. 200802841 TaxID=1193047 RepID=A0A828XZN6_9LEPT|nr:hypothetical protein LEP1GSC131_0610 [Leptospira kirschneri str. 200802841]
MTGAKEPVPVLSFFLQTIGGIRPNFLKSNSRYLIFSKKIISNIYNILKL